MPNSKRAPFDCGSPCTYLGMSADGRPFSQHARAQNISSEGALIAGVERELKVGDVIGVQCDDRKTRCTVIWVMNTGTVKKNEVGVKLVAIRNARGETIYRSTGDGKGLGLEPAAFSPPQNLASAGTARRTRERADSR